MSEAEAVAVADPEIARLTGLVRRAEKFVTEEYQRRVECHDGVSEAAFIEEARELQQALEQALPPVPARAGKPEAWWIYMPPGQDAWILTADKSEARGVVRPFLPTPPAPSSD